MKGPPSRSRRIALCVLTLGIVAIVLPCIVGYVKDRQETRFREKVWAAKRERINHNIGKVRVGMPRKTVVRLLGEGDEPDKPAEPGQ